VLIIITILILVLKTPVIPEQDLISGLSVYFEQGQSKKFELNDQEHKISVSAISGNSASIVIESQRIEAVLKVNEIKKFDLDADEVLDLRVRLKSIAYGKANLIIKKISESICEEDWDCGDWSACENGVQIRDCEDLNDCVTSQGKPIEEKECETPLPNQNQSQNDSQDIDCEDDLDCFILASETCTDAKLTQEFSINFFGLLSYSKNLMKLKGLENEKCVYYQRVLEVNISYSQELIDVLHGNNLTDLEIQQSEQEANLEAQKSVGLEQTCYFTAADLENILQKLKQGSFSSSDFSNGNCEQSCYPKSNCEESLYLCEKYGLLQGVSMIIDNKTVKVISVNSTTNSTIIEVNGVSDSINYLEIKTIKNMKIKNLGVIENLVRMEINCDYS